MLCSSKTLGIVFVLRKAAWTKSSRSNKLFALGSTSLFAALASTKRSSFFFQSKRAITNISWKNFGAEFT